MFDVLSETLLPVNFARNTLSFALHDGTDAEETTFIQVYIKSAHTSRPCSWFSFNENIVIICVLTDLENETWIFILTQSPVRSTKRTSWLTYDYERTDGRPNRWKKNRKRLRQTNKRSYEKLTDQSSTDSLLKSDSKKIERTVHSLFKLTQNILH